MHRIQLVHIFVTSLELDINYSTISIAILSLVYSVMCPYYWTFLTLDCYNIYFTHKEILSWHAIYAQFSTNLKPQPSHFCKELVETCSYRWCTDHLTAHLHSVCERVHRGTWSQRRTGSTCHRSQWRRHCSPAPCALPSASDLHSPGHKRKEK